MSKAVRELHPREKMILTAEDQMRRQGYVATSLLDVVNRSGVSRGSIYFHFPGGKEQLAEEALEHYDGVLAEAVDAAAERSESAGELVEAIAAHFASTLESSGYELGCPAVPIAAETVPATDTLTKACQRTFSRWQEKLEAHFGERGVDAASIPGLARLSIAALEGALILSRIERSSEPLCDVGRMVAANLHGAVATPA